MKDDPPLSKEYDSDSNVYKSQTISTMTLVRYIQKDMDGIVLKRIW
jgi:hypothetical protein